MPVDSNSDYYEILGIEHNATAADIKKAYKKQALQWHPDKNPDNAEEAESRFKLIAEAYEVLSDETKRIVYDKYGKEGLTGGSSSSNGSAGHRTFTTDDFNFNFNFKDPFEMFNDMFGSSFMGDDFFDGFLYQPRVVIRAGGRQRTYRQRNNPYDNNQASTFQSFGSFGGFGGFNAPFFSSMMTDDGFGTTGGTSMSFSTSFGGPTAFKSTSTSTRFENGRRIDTRTEEENGKRTVTVTENGKVTSQTVNGEETLQPIGYNSGASNHGSRENPIEILDDYGGRRRQHVRVARGPTHTHTSYSKKYRK